MPRKLPVLGQDAADSGAQRRYRGRTRWTAADDRGYRSALQPSSHSASRPTAYNLLGPGKLAPWAVLGKCNLISDSVRLAPLPN